MTKRKIYDAAKMTLTIGGIEIHGFSSDVASDIGTAEVAMECFNDAGETVVLAAYSDGSGSGVFIRNTKTGVLSSPCDDNERDYIDDLLNSIGKGTAFMHKLQRGVSVAINARNQMRIERLESEIDDLKSEIKDAAYRR